MQSGDIITVGWHDIDNRRVTLVDSENGDIIYDGTLDRVMTTMVDGRYDAIVEGDEGDEHFFTGWVTTNGETFTTVLTID